MNCIPLNRRHFLSTVGLGIAASTFPSMTAESQTTNKRDIESFGSAFSRADLPDAMTFLNGEAVKSCTVLAVQADGQDLTTIEGLADGNTLHPLQTKFIEHAALQCGICTPGFLVAAKVLLDREPNPSEEQIRYALAGNLCRCTGYDKIVRAVDAAAKEVRKKRR